MMPVIRPCPPLEQFKEHDDDVVLSAYTVEDEHVVLGCVSKHPGKNPWLVTLYGEPRPDGVVDVINAGRFRTRSEAVQSVLERRAPTL